MKCYKLNLKKLICTVSFLSVISFLALNCFAAENKPETVKAGIFSFDGYHDVDSDGNLSGYGYDILRYMSAYADFDIEYTGFEMSWSEAQDKLEAGEIDLLTSAQKTSERLERFDFSDQPVGISSTIISVRKGNTKYLFEDYGNWNGICVGMIKGNSRNDSFTEFATKHGFTYTVKFYDNSREMEDALKNTNEIDAAVSSNLRKTNDEWILSQFDTSPFYVIVKKGNTKLLGEINEALSVLYTIIPDLNDTLCEKYYKNENGGSIAFTVEENEIIASTEETPIKVGIMLSGAPICYLDKKTGKYKGICVDIVNMISEKTGLKFEYVLVDQKNTSPIMALQSGRIDLAARIFRTSDFENDKSIILSDNLMTDSICVVGRRDDDFTDNPTTKVIALPKGFMTGRSYISTHFPEQKTVEYESPEECLKAVRLHKADAAVYQYNRMCYLLLDPHNEKLCIVPSFGLELPSCIAGVSGRDEKLIEIINKGLSLITESERNTILLNYTVMNAYQLSFGDMLYKYRQVVSVIGFFFVIAVVLAVLFIIFRLRTIKKVQFAYSQTKEALSQAKMANAAKSQFLSRVSHEMRTPLNAIIGFLELSKDAEPDEVKVYISNSNIAAKQLLSVINDVLDMSAIEAGKMSVAYAPFDFKQLIHSVTNVYFPQCAQNNIEFETKLLTHIDEWVVGDQLRINQILFNLLNNAVKFTKHGKISLNISQTEIGDDKIFIRFVVSDTGCGMSDEMKDRLFKPFEQENSLTAAKYGGSGLGLSIVKNLCDMMQGAISVESTVDEGTTFTVDIPFGKSESEMDFNLPTSAKNLHVLAVDDEKNELDYLGVILKRMDIRHTCVSDGKSAIKELEEKQKANDPYQVCLIDWKMPNMDGIEATKLIRQKFGKNVLVIVISAFEHNQANECAKQAGANLFVPKPLFQSSLFDLFMTLTGGSVGKVSDNAVPDKDVFEGKRVLMAEDNAMNRMVAQALLKKMGIVCECAFDGKAALDMFEKSENGYYNAILMDVQMPNMDGLEATRCIRSCGHPDAKKIKIIALTANAFNEDIARTMSAGMNYHVAKPIDPKELFAALGNAFE